MGARNWHLVLFSLCLFFSSGLVTAIRFREDENQEISSYEFSTQLDSIPTVNPTTPGTGNPYPTINPTSPQAPSTTGPTPTTPINPYITPTSPNTNPTSPTGPYTNPTTPPSPYSIPTTPPSTTPASPTANPITPTTPGGGSGGSGGGDGSGGSGQWCVAGQSAAETTLKVALDYACGYGADCSAIQQGGSCYDPNTLKDHASYAFNDYYQKNPAPTSCAFGGAATLTNKDPSHGNCHYSSSKTTSMSPPTYVSPPKPPSPPSTMTPPSPPSTMTPTTTTPSTPGFMTPTSPGMTMPDGTSSVYGSSPTGSPNTATSVSYSVLLLFTSIWAALHVENYI